MFYGTWTAIESWKIIHEARYPIRGARLPHGAWYQNQCPRILSQLTYALYHTPHSERIVGIGVGLAHGLDHVPHVALLPARLPRRARQAALLLGSWLPGRAALLRRLRA